MKKQEKWYGLVGAVLLWAGCAVLGGQNASEPLWYAGRDITVGSDRLVGYGTGATAAAAEIMAKRDIAGQIKVTVDSRTTIERRHERVNDDESWQEKFYDVVNTRSQVVLGRTPVVKKERRGRQYYVALEYDNRSLPAKIKAACKLSGVAKDSEIGANRGYKAALPFSRALSLQGLSADTFRIRRQHGLWYVDICGQSWWIAPDIWYQQFYAEKKDTSCLRLRITPQSRLATGDRYFVKITALADGYISLFHVNETGQVLRLLLNRPVTAGQTLVYPDQSQYSGLVAEAEDFDRTRDLIIGLWSAEPAQRFSAFMAVNESFLKPDDERACSYGQLIDTMQGHCWASRFVYIDSKD